LRAAFLLRRAAWLEPRRCLSAVPAPVYHQLSATRDDDDTSHRACTAAGARQNLAKAGGGVVTGRAACLSAGVVLFWRLWYGGRHCVASPCLIPVGGMRDGWRLARARRTGSALSPSVRLRHYASRLARAAAGGTVGCGDKQAGGATLGTTRACAFRSTRHGIISVTASHVTASKPTGLVPAYLYASQLAWWRQAAGIPALYAGGQGGGRTFRRSGGATVDGGDVYRLSWKKQSGS